MVNLIKHNRFIKTAACLLFLWICYSVPLSAQYNVEVIKAAYIERITRFIEWPPPGINKDSTSFVIGVYEETMVYTALNEVFKNKTIKEKKVSIIRISDLNQFSNCDIFYISDKARPLLEKIVSSANESGVLLMSESMNFGKSGIHINFYIENDKLKFEINKNSADSGKFRISSLLLKSSKIVQ